MNATKSRCCWMVFSLVLMSALTARADIVNYNLENVILDDNTQMTGVFSWTYDIGDFENGEGQFTSLNIPWTLHDQNDLEATFDVGKSIEIVYPGSVHDDGVDITLFLLEPLTPTTSSTVDLVRSKYEIGGNGFHTGVFLGGSISPITSIPEPASFWLVFSGLAVLGLKRRKRRSKIAFRFHSAALQEART